MTGPFIPSLWPAGPALRVLVLSHNPESNPSDTAFVLLKALAIIELETLVCANRKPLSSDYFSI
jgi:hypothetical protein